MLVQNNALTFKELKDTCPKSLDRLVEWVGAGLRGFQRVQMVQLQIDTSEVKIPEITQEHAEKATEALLISYIRTLFDFFDGEKIYLTMDYIFEHGFVVNILGNRYIGEGSTSRIEAEIAGFREAFKTLEETL